jgi:murein DD-endopeptidase MepM/ murein hydrolase activator NlpD
MNSCPTHSSGLIPPFTPMSLVPVGPNHPGAFGVNRHQHVHTGVDLYAPHGCPVNAMESGTIFAIQWFTGSSIGMPWWNNTRAVYVEGDHGVFCYGEIEEHPKLKVGDKINQGDNIGHILTVLRHYKGRPMSMLHLELYDHGYKDDWSEWKIGAPKPEHLQDPTALLTDIGFSINIDPYTRTANEFH